MTPNAKKYAMFIVGTLLCASNVVPVLAPFAPALTGIGGMLIGWSGLRRPGDTAP